jgi:hypothetical protein
MNTAWEVLDAIDRKILGMRPDIERQCIDVLAETYVEPELQREAVVAAVRLRTLTELRFELAPHIERPVEAPPPKRTRKAR